MSLSSPYGFDQDHAQVRPRIASCVLLLAGLAVAIAASARAGTPGASFFDGTFVDADWIVTLTDASVNGEVTAQQTMGGNPGYYRDVEQELTDLPGLVQAIHAHTGFVFEPILGGEILSVDWSIDFFNLQVGQAVALAIEQDGIWYIGDVFVTTSFGPGIWTSRERIGLTESDFPGVDFSSNGAPLSFGFFTANSGEVGVFRVGYDNFGVRLWGESFSDGFESGDVCAWSSASEGCD